MAIPNAILNTITVEGLSRTPAQPMIPAVMISGMTLGASEHNRIRNDRNRNSIQPAISTNAHSILSRSPLIIKLLPSKYVTLVPVNSTWYLVESKSSDVFFCGFGQHSRQPFASDVGHVDTDTQPLLVAVHKTLQQAAQAVLGSPAVSACSPTGRGRPSC